MEDTTWHFVEVLAVAVAAVVVVAGVAALAGVVTCADVKVAVLAYLS